MDHRLGPGAGIRIRRVHGSIRLVRIFQQFDAAVRCSHSAAIDGVDRNATGVLPESVGAGDVAAAGGERCWAASCDCGL